MGNRAVVTSSEKEDGVYLHWNGDPEVITAIANICRAQGYRD